MKYLLSKRCARTVALLAMTLLLLSVFTSCAARKLPSQKEDLAVVGTVGEYDVLYEELRFLVLSYREQLENVYGKGIWENEATREEHLPELTELVYQDLEANYAVLSLAAKSGITAEGYEGEVKDYIKEAIDADFAGSRSIYKDFLIAAGITDHYLRFTSTVDHVYEDLYYLYLEDGTIPDGETEVKRYILQNFVRVASICLINKQESESTLNYDNAVKYRNEVLGGADIFDYVRYTLDTPEHCFGKGEMDTTFEKHAFSLQNVGDVSEVFLSEAEYLGVTKNGWYFMQRLEITEKYIEENYQTLFDQYATTVMNSFLEAEKEELVFVPNDYMKSLDLLAIEPITEMPDNTWVLILVGSVAGVVLVVGAVILFRILNRKPEPVKTYEKKRR